MTNSPEVHHVSESEDLQQLRDLFRQAPIGILRTTFDGYILTANQAFANMLGYKSFKDFSTPPRRKVTDLYEDPSSREQVIRMLAQKHDGPLHIESRWRRKDGTVFPCRIHVRATIDGSRNVKYF